MFTLFKTCDPILTKAQQCASRLKSGGTEVVAADRAVLNLCDYDWAKKLIDPGGPYMHLINEVAEQGVVIGDRPKKYLMPYPQSEWALQINYSSPKAAVRPHYDTPDYVCVILLEDFQVGCGGELRTETGETITLSRAGQAVIINGSKVKHWVERPKFGTRVSMVISLVDTRRNVVLDHMGTPGAKGIKEWVTWHRNCGTMSDGAILSELISKL